MPDVRKLTGFPNVYNIYIYLVYVKQVDSSNKLLNVAYISPVLPACTGSCLTALENTVSNFSIIYKCLRVRVFFADLHVYIQPGLIMCCFLKLETRAKVAVFLLLRPLVGGTSNDP